MATQEDELLTVAEAARLLRVTPHTIYRWISVGRLPAVRYSRRVLRIRRSDLALSAAGGGAIKEAGAHYNAGPSAATNAIEEDERREIQRFFDRYRRLRERPRPANDPPRGSWEALRRVIGIVNKETGEELYRLVMEDRLASLKDAD